MVASPAVRAAHLRARVLVDLAELREQQLPGFSVSFNDEDTSKICLVVEPVEGHLAGLRIHFDVELPAEFPLVPVKVKNSTTLDHPNVFGDWICLDILKTEEEMEYYRSADYTGGFTPGYSLLGIFQQVASFFGTDSIPQSFGGFVKVTPAGGSHRRRIAVHGARSFRCPRCPYTPAAPAPQEVLTTVPDWIKPGPRTVRASPAPPAAPGTSLLQPDRTVVGLPVALTRSQRKALRRRRAKAATGAAAALVLPEPTTAEEQSPEASSSSTPTPDEDAATLVHEETTALDTDVRPCILDRLNADALLLIFAFLPTTDLLAFTRAYTFASQLCADANIIAAREIRCFVTKKTAGETLLGVGVAWSARLKGLESPFDLLSREAFEDLGVRVGLRRAPFTHWLPLAIHAGHFARARGEVVSRLKQIERALVLGPGKGGAGRRDPSIDGYRALCSFANEIVVRLMKTADEVLAAPDPEPYQGCRCDSCMQGREPPKLSSSPAGTLLHASEKALCDFVSVVHLAVSLAATNPMVARDARAAVRRFVRYANARSKDATPDLGELLVQAALCPDVELGAPLVQEALTRHVVWMLDARQGKGLAGLALLEGEAVSEWRLATTFAASRTGLRLLMFQHLFLSELAGLGGGTLGGLKDALDARYGLPPRDMPARLVRGIKDIYAVDNFAGFALRVGLPAPGKAWMTRYLRARVQESAARGYHRVPVPPAALLRARVAQDPEWAARTAERRKVKSALRKGDEVVRQSFFPNSYASRR